MLYNISYSLHSQSIFNISNSVILFLSRIRSRVITGTSIYC